MKNTLEDLNDLRFIAAIAETGSLSGAAKRLNVNHATAFRRVTALEASLGVRLFERASGRYTPTASGEELAKAGAIIEQTATASMLKVAGRDLRPSGLVRVTTTDSLFAAFVAPIARLCRSQYLEIQLQILLSNDIRDLSKRDADIALRPALQVPDHLIGKRLGAIAHAIYGTPDYLQEHDHRDWSRHQWAALDDNLSQHRTLKWLAQFRALDSLELRTNSFSGVAEACAASLGLAILPCFIGASYQGLQRISAPLPECENQLWLLSHPDLRHTARIKTVYQFLQQEMLGHADLLAG